MDQARDDRVAAVAALEEPTRRRVYDHVARQPEAVTRDEAATALGLPRTTAAFHLDRLADAGLLDVVFERRSGRSGPGAGRPAKLYRRSTRQVQVSIPERQYELAAGLLAAALADADRTGQKPRSILDRRARQLGRRIGQAVREGQNKGRVDLDTALQVLEDQGFEPRTDGTSIYLGNCPFHTLARQHQELVCGMNLSLLTGLLDGLATTELRARLNPTPDHCCVHLEPRR
ncbi:MAG: helix-turn-helix domain-containing protein [Propionibacteriales bacterium]|nr:helix-turn-helix domain-containing protein [Propionibacteriales bacterium]